MRTITTVIITSIIAIGLVVAASGLSLGHSYSVFAQQQQQNKTNASNGGNSQGILQGKAPQTSQFPGSPVTSPSSNNNKNSTNTTTTAATTGGGGSSSKGTSNSTSSSAGTNTTLAPTPDCTAVASQLQGKAASNGSVCSVFIVRQSPIVKSQDGMPLNNFVTASNLVEIMPISATANSSSTTTAASTQGIRINGTGNVMVMGEFALLEPELVKVQKVLDEKVNVTAIHNHMIMENPKLINIHWEAHGQLTPILQLVKEALRQTSIMGSSSSSATAGGK
jgi:hypothetical protein